MALRWWLRGWGVLFALGALDFLVLPRQTVAVLKGVRAHLGFARATRLEEPGYWVPLAAAYMVLIAVFCYEAHGGAERPLRYLVVAKVVSSLAALGWFVLAGFEFPFLAAGVVDALIAAGTFGLARPLRPAGA